MNQILQFLATLSNDESTRAAAAAAAAPAVY